MSAALDKPLLLQAALDGELDAAGMLAFEQAMAEDPALAADYVRLQALRLRLREMPRVAASADLRNRIAALAGGETAKPAQKSSGWRRFAPTGLAACLAFLVGSSLTYLIVPQPPSQEVQALVGDHIRGVISGQPVDVASSERHTVKPWFASHTALSPQVVDLKDDGFPLIGGRVDVVGVTPVPTLVFRRHAHVISLAEVPNTIAQIGLGRSTLNGLAVLAWRQGSVTYVAISDAAAEELDALKAAFEKAIAAAP
jgi:anti-sigma factor RsiW